MVEKRLNLFDEVLLGVYICPLRKNIVPIPEGTEECTHLAAWRTDINKSGALAKIRIKEESDTVQY